MSENLALLVNSSSLRIQCESKTKFFGQIDGVVILDDAADLNVGQSESFCQVLQSFGLGDGLVKNLSVEIDDGAVGPDGPRPDGPNVVPALEIRDFDVGVLPPFFGQYLDAEIIVLVGGAPGIVPIHLAEQNDRRRARRLRLPGHLQFFG